MSRNPRLRTDVVVLERGSNEVQIGTDDGLVLTGGKPLRGALRLLDGQNPLRRISELTGLATGDLAALLSHLRRADLLAEPTPRPPAPRIRLLGSGVLARAFAEAYAESGEGELVLVDPAPPHPGLYDHLRPTGAETLRVHLRGLGHQRVRCAPHWYRPDGPEPTVTVLGFDRLECDRAITDTLVRNDQPHLFLRPRSDGAVVGPFVVPGATCCTRCMDLVRTRDRAWPRLLAQLCRHEVPPPPALTSWAVATTMLQLQAWLAGERPETWGATLEVRTGRWTIEQRYWPHHPDCGCAGPRPAW